MPGASGVGEDTWVNIAAGQCLIRGACENGYEADIRHGEIVIDGISVQKSFLRFEKENVARHVHENLSKLKGDSFLKSCLIISHEGCYWLAVDRFDCSLKRYCDNNPERWEGSEVSLDPNQKEDTRYQLKPTYQQIVRDIITGIYQLHSQNYWDVDLSITDILIVNHRAKFAFLRGALFRKLEIGQERRELYFEKLRTVFKGVLGIAKSGQRKVPRTELNHFHKNAARKINHWQSLAKLFFHPLLMTPMQRFHLPVAMRTLYSYKGPTNQWLENCPEGAKWIKYLRGDYKEILSYRKNNTQDQTEYTDTARDQLKFVRNTIVHFNDPQEKKVENATSSRGSNRPKKTAEEVEQELSVMLPSSFTNVYNLFNVKALASTSVHLREEKIQL